MTIVNGLLPDLIFQFETIEYDLFDELNLPSSDDALLRGCSADRLGLGTIVRTTG